jgi:CBS domain-containing protein
VYRRDVELRREARESDRPGHYRGYDERDLERQGDYRDRGRHTHYGHPTYQDLRSGRSDYEDFERREADRRRTREYESDYNRGRRGFETPYAEEPSRDYDYYEDEPWVGGSAGYNYDYQTGPPGWGVRGGRYLLCADIMTKDVTSTSPRTGVREAADKMDDENVGSLPVVENGRLIGIVTDRDIVCRVVAEGRDSQATPVSAAMSEDIVTCRPDESALEAIRKMGEHQIRRIPVCDTNGRLRGIIALADVALEAERDRELAYALEQISQPTRSRSRRV